jgi:hypothetical protein
MPGFTKDLRQHSRASTHIRDYGIPREGSVLTQKPEDLARKAWAIGQVRLHPSRKPLCV